MYYQYSIAYAFLNRKQRGGKQRRNVSCFLLRFIYLCKLITCCARAIILCDCTQFVFVMRKKCPASGRCQSRCIGFNILEHTHCLLRILSLTIYFATIFFLNWACLFVDCFFLCMLTNQLIVPHTTFRPLFLTLNLYAASARCWWRFGDYF